MDDKGTAKVILDGFCQTLQAKEPSRLICLVRSLDARIRAAGVFADEQMIALRSDLTKQLVTHDAYAIVNESRDIPEAGIEFDKPPEYPNIIIRSRSLCYRVSEGYISIQDTLRMES